MSRLPWEVMGFRARGFGGGLRAHLSSPCRQGAGSRGGRSCRLLDLQQDSLLPLDWLGVSSFLTALCMTFCGVIWRCDRYRRGAAHDSFVRQWRNSLISEDARSDFSFVCCVSLSEP